MTEPLKGRAVVVGVGGGIAAYKACELVRLLVKSGAAVSVCMTRAATQFVGPVTFQALSGRPVRTDLFAAGETEAISHVELSHRADAVLLAPATADLMARCAAGMADDPVAAVVLSTRSPVLAAPAMESGMWENPLTVANVTRLRDVARWRFIGPGSGGLASGRSGSGRMAEPEQILEAAEALLGPHDLAGKRVVVSAGPTREPVDPVRFLTNRSSGRMGYALAAAAARRGAHVTLVSGPVALAAPAGVERVRVETAEELRRAMSEASRGAHAVIMAAAVADWRAAEVGTRKMKKTDGAESMTLELVRTADVLESLREEGHGGVRVGFAAETHDVLRYAEEKLRKKGLDLIVANDVSVPGLGFDSEDNAATLLGRDGSRVTLGPMSKRDMAERILDRVVALLG